MKNTDKKVSAEIVEITSLYSQVIMASLAIYTLYILFMVNNSRAKNNQASNIHLFCLLEFQNLFRTTLLSIFYSLFPKISTSHVWDVKVKDLKFTNQWVTLAMLVARMTSKMQKLFLHGSGKHLKTIGESEFIIIFYLDKAHYEREQAFFLQYFCVHNR